jgi:hypothetical protein
LVNPANIPPIKEKVAIFLKNKTATTMGIIEKLILGTLLA